MKRVLKQSTLTLLLNTGSVVCLILIAAMIFSISVSSGKVYQASQDRFDLTYNANRFMNGSSYLTNEVRAYAATGDKEHYDNYWNEINVLKNRDIGVKNLKKIGITQEEQAKITEMSDLSNQLVPLEEAAMKNVQNGKKDAAVNYVYGDEYSDSIAKINSIKSEFLKMLDTRASQNVQSLNRRVDVLQIATIIISVFVAVMQIFSYFILRKRIIRPIIQIENGMEQLSKGNLSAEIGLEPDTSEIGQLVAAIERMKTTLTRYINDISDKLTIMADGDMTSDIDLDYIGDFKPIKASLVRITDSLSSALSQINVSAAQVSSSAGQISSGAQALSQGSTEQASSIQDLADRIHNISSGIKETADKAREANLKTERAGQEVGISNNHMAEMTEAMKRINSTSNEIGKIIKAIEDIAFQTNILALNAAVEAARAGTAGKGFAVVADEVRNLAAKSSDAAQTTTALIQECIDAIQDGNNIADATARSLENVVGEALSVTEIVEQIYRDSDIQAKSMEEATEGVNQISAVVQTNSATAEESAAASEELDSQAELLKGLVDNFKLKA